MKALYYQPYDSFLILTPKAFKKIKHLIENKLVLKHHGFFLIRSGCPFYHREYNVKDKESFCHSCKSRLKKEMGSCQFNWKPENPALFSLGPIVEFLNKKKIPSDERIYYQYNNYCYADYEGYDEYMEEEMGWVIFFLFILILPLANLCFFVLKVYEMLSKPFRKKV